MKTIKEWVGGGGGTKGCQHWQSREGLGEEPASKGNSRRGVMSDLGERKGGKCEHKIICFFYSK